VGDEHMGRFIREELVREGVCVDGVITDGQRLTALVLLGIRDETRFPLIFYRENCADMALTVDDIDPAFIARARAVVATGTHLSHPRTAAAVLKALTLARENGAKTALDIDYRPNLWGLSGHGDGESRFIESAAVTARLQATLHLFDLIVGTEVPTPSPPCARCGQSRAPRWCANAGRWGRWHSPAPLLTPWMQGSPDPAFRSRCSTCWVPATASCQAF
jgi:sugar/nucleoside kinase (ribokinase family)